MALLQWQLEMWRGVWGCARWLMGRASEEGARREARRCLCLGAGRLRGSGWERAMQAQQRLQECPPRPQLLVSL